MEGQFNLKLLRLNEEYVCTYPTFWARGVVIGKLRLEVVAQTFILCRKNQLRCNIDFKG
jgi:hypothetical protein